MISLLSLILYIIIFLLFIPTKSDTVHQLRDKRKRRSELAEFDIPTEENLHFRNVVHRTGVVAKNIGGKLETKLGHSYELLGHHISHLGSQLEQNKNSLAEKATNIYKGPIANKTGIAFENIQYGYGKLGDRLSFILNWLGENVITLGNHTSSIIRSSFYTIGDIIGYTIEKTERLVGKGLMKTSLKVHRAATDLQHTSHIDSQHLQDKFQETAPKFKQSINRLISTLGEKIHTLGIDTETAGRIIEQHHFLDTLQQAYDN
ncbi:unnamed protein product [Rotaria sp. Silwood2]|nr:unnamed protein product [Rotaria sp. Silwood2]CAF3062469.1 unnamed protein product [Rotaria sp. Silwood2]CAF3296630.1 unnamed protein product [Rotaria sp. Silwood2]CAF3428176.1 unnamed protein product [Rotaria sp. Silwood2]CAF4225509.1 unnamed protein product [Rotaria sp. Silwood2]